MQLICIGWLGFAGVSCVLFPFLIALFSMIAYPSVHFCSEVCLTVFSGVLLHRNCSLDCCQRFATDFGLGSSSGGRSTLLDHFAPVIHSAYLACNIICRHHPKGTGVGFLNFGWIHKKSNLQEIKRKVQTQILSRQWFQMTPFERYKYARDPTVWNLTAEVKLVNYYSGISFKIFILASFLTLLFQ